MHISQFYENRMIDEDILNNYKPGMTMGDERCP